MKQTDQKKKKNPQLALNSSLFKGRAVEEVARTQHRMENLKDDTLYSLRYILFFPPQNSTMLS